MGRRHASKAFVEAVGRGLEAIGDKSMPTVMANILISNEKVEVSEKGAPFGRRVIDNPHVDGKNTGTVADTIRRMAGK